MRKCSIFVHIHVLMRINFTNAKVFVRSATRLTISNNDESGNHLIEDRWLKNKDN